MHSLKTECNDHRDGGKYRVLKELSKFWMLRKASQTSENQCDVCMLVEFVISWILMAERSEGQEK